MGGRGSWSMSHGNKIHIMGNFSGVRGLKIDETPERRSDLVTLAKRAGFVEIVGTQDFDTAVAGAYLNHLGGLERKYGAIGSTPTIFAAAGGSGFYGAAGDTTDGRMALILHKQMGKLPNFTDKQRNEQAKGYTSATDGKITSVANYTVTHEYGHLLHASLAKRTGKSELQLSKEVQSIAEKKYGGSNKNVSGYARTNYQEFFAEAFASSQLGAPNPSGKAMLDFLAQNGY